MSRYQRAIIPLTEAEMEARIKEGNRAVSAGMMRALLTHEHLRPEVKDFIQRALTIHNLDTP